jgi:hypothetical protein
VPEVSSAAGQEVAALLRRLGHRSSAAAGEGTRSDGTTDHTDERVQEQRPG